MREGRSEGGSDCLYYSVRMAGYGVCGLRLVSTL